VGDGGLTESEVPDQRDEHTGAAVSGLVIVRAAKDESELLMSRRADRDHQAAAIGELARQGIRDPGCR
jgi:hypothetical protein